MSYIDNIKIHENYINFMIEVWVDSGNKSENLVHNHLISRVNLTPELLGNRLIEIGNQIKGL